VDQASVEDQADLVGAAGVEVVADDVLEERPPGDRPVQDYTAPSSSGAPAVPVRTVRLVTVRFSRSSRHHDK
jgi:hypothetical protein